MSHLSALRASLKTSSQREGNNWKSWLHFYFRVQVYTSEEFPLSWAEPKELFSLSSLSFHCLRKEEGSLNYSD